MRILFLIYNKASLCSMSGDMLLARHRLEPMPNATISFSAHYAEQGKTIYSSARDIGNYTAGYITGHLQVRWDWARTELDRLESQQQGHSAVEGFSSQNAQLRGWNVGLQSSYDNPVKTLRWTTKSMQGGMKWLYNRIRGK
jgi:hypothetical protein